MFSGAEQLVESFFIELSAELKLRPDLAEIGDDLADYGEAFAGLSWLPFVGPWIERGRHTAKILGKFLGRRREGAQGRRRKLADALRQLSKPIVVVLDDVDRLSSPEIRDIFKLVRLTASFPNVIYIVAFDRVRVEQALTEEGVPGRDYLEKILQVAVDLPVVPQEVMVRQVGEALDQALAGTDVAELDTEVWPDVLMEIIKPLIRNMRDVRRYAAAVHTTADSVGKQVALADLLGIEAIRVFLPGVFAQIQVSVEGLCTPSPGFGGAGRYEDSQSKDSIDRLLRVAEKNEPVVKALIQRLFPFARRHIENNNYGSDWQKTFLRNRRIAHRAILGVYLERVPGSELMAFTYAEKAWQLMGDAPALDAYLRSLQPERQEDVVAALEAYEDEYRLEQALVAVPVLLNFVSDLPDRPRGMFEMDARLVVGRVVYRLLRAADDEEEIRRAVAAILPEVKMLSAKFNLLSIVGYREGAGHKLISEDASRDFERQWREEVREATGGELSEEDDLLRVLFFAKNESEPNEDQLVVPADPRVTLASLKSARSETLSQGGESRAVRRTPVFAWSTLERVYGDEVTLITRIEELKSSDIDIEPSLRELIEKYLGGWRPREFADERGDE